MVYVIVPLPETVVLAGVRPEMSPDFVAVSTELLALVIVKTEKLFGLPFFDSDNVLGADRTHGGGVAEATGDGLGEAPADGEGDAPGEGLAEGSPSGGVVGLGDGEGDGDGLASSAGDGDGLERG